VRARAWITSVLLGAAVSFAVVELGVIGFALLAAAVGLIAWKGPALLAGGGLLSGFGLTWLLLFGRVQLTCGAGAVFPDSSCMSEDLTGWIVGSAAILGLGLLATAVGWRRAR
jgi:hypothetical protein